MMISWCPLKFDCLDFRGFLDIKMNNSWSILPEKLVTFSMCQISSQIWFSFRIFAFQWGEILAPIFIFFLVIFQILCLFSWLDYSRRFQCQMLIFQNKTFNSWHVEWPVKKLMEFSSLNSKLCVFA